MLTRSPSLAVNKTHLFKASPLDAVMGEGAPTVALTGVLALANTRNTEFF
jgi:hypothetical protein